METCFYYILRVSIAAVLMYICYKLFISKTTFHNVNRAVLLGIFAATLLLPFVSIQLPDINWFQRQGNSFTDYRQLLLTEVEEDGSLHTTSTYPFSGFQLFFALYSAGIIFCILRYAIAFVRMSQLVRSARKTKLADGTEIYISSQDIAPFSWMNTIVIGAKDFTDESRDIISHEKSHVNRKHSIDLLLVDVYCTFFWFNPFAWLLRNELRNTHEYQADLDATAAAIDLKAYQLLLIRHCVGEHKFSSANNFELNNLQKRIQMIRKNKSSNKAKWLYSSLISAVIATLLLLSADSLQAKNQSTPAVSTENFADKKDNTDSKPTELQEEKERVEIKIIGTGSLDKSTGEDLQSITKGKVKKIIFEKDSSSTDGISIKGKKVLVFIDGKEVPEEELNKIDTDKIESMSIYKGKDAEKIYDAHDKKAKDGVIYITTKNSKSTNISLDPENKPLIILDGKEVGADTFKTIDPEDIESISVLKDESATSTYGEKGKNGVILITSKNGKE